MVSPLHNSEPNLNLVKPNKKTNSLRRLLSFKSEKTSNDMELTKRISKSFRSSTTYEFLNPLSNFDDCNLKDLHVSICQEKIFHLLNDDLKIKWGQFLFEGFPQNYALDLFSSHFYTEKEIKNLINLFKILKKEDRKGILLNIPHSYSIHLIRLCKVNEIKLCLNKCEKFPEAEQFYNLLTKKQIEKLHLYYFRKFEKNNRYYIFLKNNQPWILALMIKNLYIHDFDKMHELICNCDILNSLNHNFNQLICKLLKPSHWAIILPDLSHKLLKYLRGSNFIDPYIEISAYGEMRDILFEKMINENKLPEWISPETVFIIKRDKINRISLMNDTTKYYEIAESVKDEIINLKKEVEFLKNQLNEIISLLSYSDE